MRVRDSQVVAGKNGRRRRPRPGVPAQRAILDLLHGRVPEEGVAASDIEAALKRYECGGWLRHAWATAGKLQRLQPEWRAALERLHDRTKIDNLAALAEFRLVGRLLHDNGIPVMLLKGADYLIDLYDDPAERVLTDVDLLVRPEDADRAARLLREHGYEPEVGADYPENRRFEMRRPGAGRCRFEIHWRLGLPRRSRIGQRAIWARSRSCELEQVPCRRLDVDDAVLFHAYHQADHHFGPTLKWVLDLRLMFHRRRPDPARLASRSGQFRVRTAFYLALRHLESIFPGTTPEALLRDLLPGRTRLALLQRRLLDEPVEFMNEDPEGPSRYPTRLLLTDGILDALALALRVLARPIVRPVRRALGEPGPAWGDGSRIERGGASR